MIICDYCYKKIIDNSWTAYKLKQYHPKCLDKVFEKLEKESE